MLIGLSLHSKIHYDFYKSYTALKPRMAKSKIILGNVLKHVCSRWNLKMNSKLGCSYLKKKSLGYPNGEAKVNLVDFDPYILP